MQMLQNSDVHAADILVTSEAVPELFAFPTHLALGQLEQFTREELRKQS